MSGPPSPSHYTIRIDGHLDDYWSQWLGGFTITHAPDGTTTLTGAVTDQAQLHGILAGLRDMGTTLIDLARVTEPRARG
jgi:hypothetical protein